MSLSPSVLLVHFTKLDTKMMSFCGGFPYYNATFGGLHKYFTLFEKKNQTFELSNGLMNSMDTMETSWKIPVVGFISFHGEIYKTKHGM